MIQINRIKDKLKSIQIIKVAEELGIVHKGKSARCFMHDDKNPSLGFNTLKNTWKCYVCNKGGDQISLVMEKLNLSYVDSCKWLADRFNITIPNDDGYRKKISDRTFTGNSLKKTDDLKCVVDLELISWIVDNAKLSLVATNFLYEQRKYNPDVVSFLKIGSISDPLKLINALTNTFGIDRALKSGIVRKNSRGLYLFFYTPCLIFPYFDVEGNLITIQTRYLGTDKKAPRFQFLPNSPTVMFNMPILKNISVDDNLFISEGITDCIALLSTNRKAVAIPSATLLHDSDVKLLAPNCLFMYPDKDEAGELLYNNLKEKLRNFGSMIMKLHLPEDCKDYSDYYLKKMVDNE